MNDNPYSDSGLNDLLTPTLQDQSVSAPTAKPWRVESQFYVAFFGGVLPLTVIACLNAKRLGLPYGKRKQVLLLGTAVLAITFVGVVFYLHSANLGDLGLVAHNPAVRRSLRWGPRIAAILLYLALRHIQNPADRLYRFNTDDEAPYASLWVPGLLAVVALGALQSFALLAVAASFS